MKFAAKVSPRSVITTGRGSTSAGLTASAVKDGQQWLLEVPGGDTKNCSDVNGDISFDGDISFNGE